MAIAANGAIATMRLLRRDRPEFRERLLSWVLRNIEQSSAGADTTNGL